MKMCLLGSYGYSYLKASQLHTAPAPIDGPSLEWGGFQL